MSAGEIAGLIAAIAFAVLTIFLIYPLIRLAKLFDQLSDSVQRSTDHAIDVIDESALAVQQVNKSLEDVNAISSATRTTVRNASALANLYGAFFGKPIIKSMALLRACKTTMNEAMTQYTQRKSTRKHDAGAPIDRKEQ